MSNSMSGFFDIDKYHAYKQEKYATYLAIDERVLIISAHTCLII